MAAPSPLNNLINSDSDSNGSTVGWIIASIASSVGLILILKVIMGPVFGFTYVFTLTALHFYITAIGMEIMALMGLFIRQRLPLYDTIIMAIFCIGSVGFMNFSLQYNSVGFYQLCKLCCIPAMVIIQSIVYNQSFTNKVKFTLLIILAGVGIATISDLSLNLLGSIYGILAVLFTTQFQIWQGDKQKLFKLSAMQINHAQALPSALFCTILALIFEFQSTDKKHNILLHIFQSNEISWILLSAVLALSVNLCTYGLIGKTSPVTYQVVGHAKTILILIGGFILYPIATNKPGADSKLIQNISGIILAMIGVIIYGHLRYYETLIPKPADIYDQLLPNICIKWLNGTTTNSNTAEYELVSQQSINTNDTKSNNNANRV